MFKQCKIHAFGDVIFIQRSTASATVYLMQNLRKAFESNNVASAKKGDFSLSSVKKGKVFFRPWLKTVRTKISRSAEKYITSSYVYS
jgi:hypothetical protein